MSSELGSVVSWKLHITLAVSVCRHRKWGCGNIYMHVHIYKHQKYKKATKSVILYCKNLRVVSTLLWVISVACSGASIIPSVVSAAI